MSIHINLVFLGFVLGSCATIAGINIVVEQLFRGALFTSFLQLAPVLMQSFLPNDTTTLWFAVRANKSLYNGWDVALIYLVLLPMVFMLFVGCWLFLVLALLRVFNIGALWLIIWFVVTAVVYFVSASNQYALEIKSHDKRLGVPGVKNRMFADPMKTVKRVSFIFVVYWVSAPLGTLAIYLITVLFVLIHWPAWLIQTIPALRFDLTNKRERQVYYGWYAAVLGVTSLALVLLH